MVMVEEEAVSFELRMVRCRETRDVTVLPVESRRVLLAKLWHKTSGGPRKKGWFHSLKATRLSRTVLIQKVIDYTLSF